MGAQGGGIYVCGSLCVSMYGADREWDVLSVVCEGVGLGEGEKWLSVFRDGSRGIVRGEMWWGRLGWGVKGINCCPRCPPRGKKQNVRGEREWGMSVRAPGTRVGM